MDGFGGGERLWVERLGSLRNTVRQTLIARQLQQHRRPGWTVLDVGCGQGTQALLLAQSGCRVVGVDPSADLLALAAAAKGQAPVEFRQGSLTDLPRLVGEQLFDLVCAHGLLMYLEDLDAALADLAARVVPGGLLSITFRNGDALAFRPGMRAQWTAALHAFDQATYINELGVQAQAHRLDDVLSRLERLGFGLVQWYGVRVFTDPADSGEAPPAEELDELLEAEWLASCRDPYRGLGSQIHLVVRRR